MREDCSPRHVPNEIRQIEAVPRTLSGKVLEVPVKRILTGTPPEQAASRESLANPEALDYFVEAGGRVISLTFGRLGRGRRRTRGMATAAVLAGGETRCEPRRARLSDRRQIRR